jgi:beta-glucosidase
VKRAGWFCAGAFAVAALPVARAEDIPAYKAPRVPIEARVKDLLGRMTLEEKVAQLQSNSTIPAVPGLFVGPTPAAGIIKKGQVEVAVARRSLSSGMGAFTLIAFAPLKPADSVAQQNAIQSWVLANTRLGIPIIFQAEGLHGAVIGGATSFPQAVGLGSTWDPDLIRRMFGVVAKEERAAGMSMVLAPVLDLARDPRFGRVEEMYSEDPYLVGEIGVAAVEGLQGTGALIDQDHVIATAKHFVHGQPESGTNTAPNDVSERTMRDTFLVPFEKAVRVANIGAVMPSYNENNGGVPSHANAWLLKDILRKEWGFGGVTNSDWFAVPELHSNHHIAASDAQAGILAFNAGLDLETPNAAGYAALSEAVHSGKISAQDIDGAVARVLALKFRAGLFEHPLTDAQKAADVGAKTAIPLARKVADESMVLLKNDGGLLPLNPTKIHSIAVIGPNADKVRLGGYSGTPPYFVTVLEGIRKRLGEKVQVSYAEGVRISEPDTDPSSNKMVPYSAPSAEKDQAGIAQAVETARNAEAIILVLGGNETVTREAVATLAGRKPALGDSDDLDLPGRQNELVQLLIQLNKPTVAVLLNGRAQSIVALSQSVPVILEGWYLGQETGNAVAGVLFGDTNPSGKLPVTLPRSAGQLPVFYYRTPQARLGYVFNDNSALYPFGFGLSFTSFGYGKPTFDRAQIDRNATAKISVRVTNTGARAGDDIAQLYIHPQVSSVVQPVLRLAGFERIHLNPGQAKTVSFQVGPAQLAIWNQEMRQVVEPGKFDISVGPSSAQIDTVELEVTP